jgi:hypothetical protein
MKIEEVTLEISLQLVSSPRFSLAPANCDQNTLLAVNRNVGGSNPPRGAKNLFLQALTEFG